MLMLNRTDPALLTQFDHLIDSLHEWRAVGPSKLEEVLVWSDEVMLSVVAVAEK